MANSTTTQILLDGPRNVVVKFEGVLDSGDLASTTVLDPSALQGIDFSGAVKAQNLRIEEIQYSIEDLLSVNLFWDATSPVRIEELVGRGKMKYWNFGGLVNNAGAGRTGKITATTQGASAGQILSFSLIITCIKTAT